MFTDAYNRSNPPSVGGLVPCGTARAYEREGRECVVPLDVAKRLEHITKKFRGNISMQLPNLENLTTRTEQEAVNMAPIRVKFGTATYDIPVLGMSKQAAWRQKFFDIAINLEGQLEQDPTTPRFQAGLAFVLLRFPEKVAELVFEYAGDVLPKDVVLDQGTDEQMARAFSRIWMVAFPYGPALALTVQTWEKAKKFQASARSTN